MGKKNLNDIPHDVGSTRPATDEERKEIVRVLGEGIWMVASVIIRVPVNVVKGVAKIVKVNKDD